MIEIAISLAIIGIALVSIIGILPIGLNTQQDNREETLINQDATVLMEAIRGGARGLDDLTNYVYAITNYWTNVTANTMGTYGYTYNNSALNGTPMVPLFPIFDGRRIVGLLSTPEYTDTNGFPLSTLMFGGISNHVVAYVRSISGPAVEKPPQDNDIMREDSFGYRVLCVNLPTAVDTNLFNPVFYPNGPSAYTTKFAANLHDLRLTFLWPQRPNGNVGPGRQTFRTLVGGQIEIVTNGLGRNLYFYQPQLFINAP